MNFPVRIFVDSDVIISSLISKKGAAYLLLNNQDLNLYISQISIKEIKIVIDRMKLDKNQLNKLIRKKFKIINLKPSLQAIKTKYKNYVKDINDAHLIAGAHLGKIKFLITYNKKHFFEEKIKRDFKTMIVSPGKFLQYLRSLR